MVSSHVGPMENSSRAASQVCTLDMNSPRFISNRCVFDTALVPCNWTKDVENAIPFVPFKTCLVSRGIFMETHTRQHRCVTVYKSNLGYCGRLHSYFPLGNIVVKD